MAKIYVMTCKEIDEETGDERMILGTEDRDGKFSGFTLLADVYGSENAAVCTIMHDNISNIAAKMAAEHRTLAAARLACIMNDRTSQSKSLMEDALMSMIAGGDSNGFDS